MLSAPDCDIVRIYDPRMLSMMATALDNACNCIPKTYKESYQARRKLALLVIRHVDRGERDPRRLADLAILDFLR
jgi:hypothetical protein